MIQCHAWDNKPVQALRPVLVFRAARIPAAWCCSQSWVKTTKYPVHGLMQTCSKVASSAVFRCGSSGPRHRERRYDQVIRACRPECEYGALDLSFCLPSPDFMSGCLWLSLELSLWRSFSLVLLHPLSFLLPLIPSLFLSLPLPSSLPLPPPLPPVPSLSLPLPPSSHRLHLHLHLPRSRQGVGLLHGVGSSHIPQLYWPFCTTCHHASGTSFATWQSLAQQQNWLHGASPASSLLASTDPIDARESMFINQVPGKIESINVVIDLKVHGFVQMAVLLTDCSCADFRI